MIATASGAMLAGVAETEPRRIWFGRGGCVEQHDDGTYAVFVRGALLGIYAADDVGSRDVFISVVRDEASREDLARAFRVSAATVGRVITRLNQGGLQAVADYGRHGGKRVRTPKLVARLEELFERGLGPHQAHQAVVRKVGYGTVWSIHDEWQRKRHVRRLNEEPTAPQATLSLLPVEEATTASLDAPVMSAPAPGEAVVEKPASEPPLEAVVSAPSEMIQHVGTWLLLGMLERLGFYDLAAASRGDVATTSLRPALDAAAIALALGEGSVEGVRRLATPSAGTLLRHRDGITASWVRRVLHEFADHASETFPGLMANQLLARSGEGEDRVWLYVDNHMRPYTGQHVVRKGWRMQDKRAVPGTTDYYVHDEEGCPLFRLATTSHDSLTDWLMPVVEFAKLSLGEEVKPVLVFDRGGAFPSTMEELREAGAEFVTYERKPYRPVPVTEFTEALTITLPSAPRRPIRISYLEAPEKNLRQGRGRVRRIAMLTEEGVQVNLLAVSELSAETLIRGHLARWGRQENQFKYEVERWGINHLDGRRVEEYPPDALIPNPARRRLDRLLHLSHTAEGEAWRRWGRAPEGPERDEAKRDVDRAMERQQDLMAQRVSVPKVAKVSETPLAGKLMRHELGYKNVLDSLRIALANLESDLAVMLAPRLDRPREVKKLLATLFTAPGTVRVSSRAVTVKIVPAANDSERDALRAFLRDVTRMRLVLPGDPDSRRLRWVLK
jgi:transposase